MKKITRKEALLALPGITLWVSPHLSAAGRPPTGRIVFITDIHAMDQHNAFMGMEQAASAINRLRPDAVITGGDLVSGGYHQPAAASLLPYKKVREMFSNIDAPVFPVLGNHDLTGAVTPAGPGEDPRHEFKNHFSLPSTWYSADILGIRCFFLDSIRITDRPFPYEGDISREQCRWIESELSPLPKEHPLILVSHIPLASSLISCPVSTGPGINLNRIVGNRDEVLKLFGRRNLIAVLQGHLHIFDQFWAFGTRFITGGAVCGKWWQGSWLGTHEGFTVMDFQGDRIARITYQGFGWTAAGF